MQHYDLLALGAATCWAASGLLSAAPSKALGAIAFVRWRMTTVTFVLWLLVALFSQLPPLAVDTWGVMVASGLVGIFVGDTLLFAAMNRLGPRRTGVLFASHALFSALLGYLFLSERLGVQAYIGAGVTVAGVMVAVAWGNSKTNVSEWDSAPSTVAGVSLALLAALGQATGALIAKPALGGDLGFDPVAASAVRVTAAVSALWLWRVVNPRSASAHSPLTWTLLKQTAISSWVGMGLGMGLLLWALRDGPVGSVGVLSGLSPVLILPMLWWTFRSAPAPGAWIGAAVAVLGTAMVVAR
ncbi:MAG: DMT family transporter [Burkholderiaceae bacterium]|jgi:drug/metabolite transporter (DMT)-like permease|tara:strand:- start:3949 stop:4845 length:897 start_codon:yes stop_codon:yes gene_type:complete